MQGRPCIVNPNLKTARQVDYTQTKQSWQFQLYETAKNVDSHNDHK